MSNPTAGSGYRQRTTNSRQWVSWGCKGMFREVKNYHTETPRIPGGTLSVPCGHHPQLHRMRKYNPDAPGVKLRGRPKKESGDKRDRKVSVNFTDAEEREVKAKAAAAGISIAELLRISAFKLSILERLTDFEREALRELMYQGKNLNDQVRACQANAWPSTKRKAEACLDGILAILSKLKVQNSTLL